MEQNEVNINNLTQVHFISSIPIYYSITFPNRNPHLHVETYDLCTALGCLTVFFCFFKIDYKSYFTEGNIKLKIHSIYFILVCNCCILGYFHVCIIFTMFLVAKKNEKIKIKTMTSQVLVVGDYCQCQQFFSYVVITRINGEEFQLVIKKN